MGLEDDDPVDRPPGRPALSGADVGSRHRRRTGALVVVLVVLSLAVGVVLGRVTAPRPEPVQSPGLAAAEVSERLAARIEAVNAGDAEAVASFYTPDAVLEERDVDPPFVTVGAEQIGERLEGLAEFGFTLTGRSAVVQVGPYAAEAASWAGGGRGVLVYRLDGDGLIVHQWVIG